MSEDELDALVERMAHIEVKYQMRRESEVAGFN